MSFRFTGTRRPRSPYRRVGFAGIDSPFNENPLVFQRSQLHMPSIFSKIIAREIPARILYEDDQVIAFLDINPIAPGHTLVVPKHEEPNLLASSEEDMIAVIRAVRLVAPAILKAVGAEGFTTTSATGAVSGQSVFHTHIHIIPRFPNDGHLSWQPTTMSAEALDEVSAKIKNYL